ncbi:PPR repeat, partial [Musa troglodytarum]
NQLCLCLRDTSITFGHPLKCLEDFAFEWMVIMLTHWTFCFPECFKLLWCHDPEGGLYGLVDWTILRCAEPVFHVMAPTGFNAETFGFSMRPRMVGKQRRLTATQMLVSLSALSCPDYLCLVYWNLYIVVSDRQTVAPKAPLAGVLCSFCLLLTVLLLGFSVLPQPGNLAYELILFPQPF